jgi:hydrogenase maturation protease
VTGDGGNSQERLRLLVVGVGNAYRSDDAVGLIAARRVREEVGDLVTVREESGEGTALIESWRGADTVILIDAVRSSTEPGALCRFDARVRPLPATLFPHSTHAFGVAEAVELARALDQLPSHLIVYGIEGKTFTAGVELSPEVEKAIAGLVERVRQELERWKLTTTE